MSEQGIRGSLLTNEPMAGYTSWRVGGPADKFFVPADIDDLVAFLPRQVSSEPLFWLGLGSNVLVRDGGIRGTVIRTTNVLQGLYLHAENVIWADAGVPCAKVARFSARNNLAGAEFLAGIPGTIGGALALNAGAFGRETWELVQRVQTISAAGILRYRFKNDFEVDYRDVAVPEGEWFVGAELALHPGQREQSEAMIRACLAKRSASQPVGQACCGSVFRNPDGDFAGRLIETCGLKGTAIGGASVSLKHANFIINDGCATAADIETLIDTVHRKVLEETGVDLKLEVHILGESLPAHAGKH